MVEKAANWLTRIVIGDDTISRIAIVVIPLSTVVASYVYISKDCAIPAEITVGELSQ